jgi:hypothetical protein
LTFHRKHTSFTSFLIAVSRLVAAFEPLFACIVVLASFPGPVSFRTRISFDAVTIGNHVDRFVSFARQIDGFDVKNFSIAQSFPGVYQLSQLVASKGLSKGSEGLKAFNTGSTAMKYETK